MNIIPWRKREEEETTDLARSFSELQREMNCLFDNFFGRGGLELPVTGFAPSVDVTETEEDLVVKADLPGLTEKDIEVSLADGFLVLQGEKREEKEENRSGVYRIERSYGAFHRRVPLPVEIEADKVEAHFDKGVLTVKLPKVVEHKTEGVKVNVKAV